MKRLVIMRGLPGSGKSTLARQLLGPFRGVICSADDYFTNADGIYRFDPTKLREAHTSCRRKAEWAMRTDIPLIVIDNTNVSSREWAPYVSLADQYGYQVQFLEPATPWAKDPAQLTIRNTHGVPQAAIERMLARWEEPALSANVAKPQE